MFAKYIKWSPIPVLLIAIFWNPSIGYSVILQLVTCLAAILVVEESFRDKNISVALVFIAIAAIFNPIVPVSLPRSVFQGIASVCLAAFVFSALTFRQRPTPSIASITDRTPGSESL